MMITLNRALVWKVADKYNFNSSDWKMNPKKIKQQQRLVSKTAKNKTKQKKQFILTTSYRSHTFHLVTYSFSPLVLVEQVQVQLLSVIIITAFIACRIMYGMNLNLSNFSTTEFLLCFHL